MAHFDKARVGADGFTFQVGTLSGNPIAAVAGLKTLEILRRPGSYKRMRETGRTIMAALGDHLNRVVGTPHRIVGDPVLFDVVFTERPVRDYRDVLGGDAKSLKVFNTVLRQRGILKSEGKFYISLAHNTDDVEQTAQAIAAAADRLGEAA